MGLVMFAILGALVGLLIGASLEMAPRGSLPAVIGLTGGVFGGTGVAFLVGMDPLAQAWSLLAWVGALAGAVVVMALYALIVAPGSNPAQSATGSGDRTTGAGSH
ncbi:MAG: hypothetical protein WD080_11735 [Egibacteraceae bacterium]